MVEFFDVFHSHLFLERFLLFIEFPPSFKVPLTVSFGRVYFFNLGELVESDVVRLKLFIPPLV